MALDSYGKKFLKKMAEALFWTLAEEVPGVGTIIRFGRRCGQVLKDMQEAIPQPEQRIVQLEQAGACSPSDAQQIAIEVVAELQRAGQVVSAEQAAVMQELMLMTPTRIRDCTRTTLNHAKRLGTALATVLPVTAQFSDVDREVFYTSLYPQQRLQFRSGDTLPGNSEWQLESWIGTGGFGEVWLAQSRSVKLRCAVKFCQNTANAHMLKKEAEKLVAIQQQLPAGTAHVVALLNLNLTVMPYWLAFEYVDGGTLESRMRLGAMDWPTAWDLYRPLLQGMAHVHELGIVHRDLKPANILLMGGTVPRIADFGIGKVLAEHKTITQLDRSRSHIHLGSGTQGYMSPEQEEGQEAHTADDVYALGVLLWQMLAGSLKPLRFERDVNKLNVSDLVKTTIRDCVFMPREERIVSARELLNRLTPKPTILTVAPQGGQYSTINAALAAIAPDGIIYVKPGTYKESLRLEQPVTIIGIGPPQYIVIEGAAASCITMATTTATVRGLTIRGITNAQCAYAVDIPTGELMLEDCDISSKYFVDEENDDDFYDEYGAVVRIYGSNAKPILHRCVIHDCTGNGILVTDNSSGLLEQCDIYANRWYGISIRTGGNPTMRNCTIHDHDGVSKCIYVTDNGSGLFEQCDIYGNKFDAILITNGGNPTMRNCKIHDNDSSGIDVLMNGSGQFEQCDIYGNKHKAVSIGSDSNPTMRNCKIHDNDSSGIDVLMNGSGLFEQCDIYGNKHNAVSIGSDSNPTMRNCKIHDNDSSGIDFSMNGSGLFEQCDIYGNKHNAVSIENDSNPTMCNCKIHDNDSSGINVSDNGSGLIEHCDIYGNKNAGIWIDDNSNPTVRNCKIHDGKSNGIFVIGGKGLFDQCDIYANDGSGINILMDSNPTVQNCKIRDGNGRGVYVHMKGSGTFENCDLRGNKRGAWNIEAGCQVTRRNNRE